jgi:hypothetical protein
MTRTGSLYITCSFSQSYRTRNRISGNIEVPVLREIPAKQLML